MDFTKNRLDILMPRLRADICRKNFPIDGFGYIDSSYCSVGDIPGPDTFRPYHGENWAAPERENHGWFFKQVDIPQDCNPADLELQFHTCPEGWYIGNPQMMVYIDGELAGALDWQHTSIPVPQKRSFALSVYAYIGRYVPGGCESECFFDGDVTFGATIVEKDRRIEHLYYDLHVPYMALDDLNKTSPEYFSILNVLNDIFNILDFRRKYSDAYYASIARAQHVIDQFYQDNPQIGGPLVTLVGQTHIDVAWLWTKEQVKEKTIRSFATAVELMNRYPDYRFMMGQPALYAYCKESAPALYTHIKELVQQGRWEPEGALWVESDCNLLSGESMVRQIMTGKQFFREEFGVDSKVAWLPDTFGFSPSIPQIFAKCGIEKFVTSKLSWNEVDTQPYDTFLWKGIDGSTVFGYFLTAQDFHRGADTERLTIYNARLTVTQVFGTVDRYEPKRLNTDVLLTYGFGDGGGGPTAEYLEIMKRLNRSLKGIPKTESGTVTGFLDKLYHKLKDHKQLPVWTGELYFEHHRGTYTSIAQIKRNNRKAEFALMNAEAASVLSGLLFDTVYEKALLDTAWKTVLTNQFHDVLPGSSIRDVYEETQAEYAQVFSATDALQNKLFANLSGGISRNKFVVLNPNNRIKRTYAKYNDLYYEIDNPAPKGYRVYDFLSCDCTVTVNDHSIENAYLKVSFDSNYEISSIFDKAVERELLKEGTSANSLIAFEDIPGSCDAWELQTFYTEKKWRIQGVDSVEQICEGARAGFLIRRSYFDSQIVQKIVLYNASRRIDFETELNWQEQHTVLKAEFPVDINFSRSTADTLFGSTERPAFVNTSWDEARFETCAHKYMDVSDGGYGVSFLNDCKYGYDVLGGIPRLTLLKCAAFPYPEGDKGKHVFTYSLFPHSGPLGIETIWQAYDLNNPVQILPGAGTADILPLSYSLVSADTDSVIIETIKKAESSNEIVVRLYESQNASCNPRLSFGFDICTAEVCDLLENPLAALPVQGNQVQLHVKPFEIITLKVTLRRSSNETKL